MWFTSDNAGPAHPSVLAALAAANEGYAPSYGGDRHMDAARERVREIFEAPEAEVFLVSTGTAANSLSLACLCPPWATVYCHDEAHVETDECAAPEFFTGGAKLTCIGGADGRIDADALDSMIAATGRLGVHGVQRGALTITQATEAGTIYSLADLKRLGGIADRYDVPVHMDGARFTNALVSLGCSPAEMTWKAGVNILSFGGTKNGLMAAEAVVLFDPAKAWEFELRRKRGAHLFSKHRYLSAQMEAYLTDDLWRQMARQANDMAARLSTGITTLDYGALMHPTQANAVFATLPRAVHQRAMAGGAHYYLWPGDPDPDGPEDTPVGCRLVCNWSTTEADVDALLAAFASG